MQDFQSPLSSSNLQPGASWSKVILIVAYCTILALAGILTDVIIANITGGNLADIPQMAVSRFEQFH